MFIESDVNKFSFVLASIKIDKINKKIGIGITLILYLLSFHSLHYL